MTLVILSADHIRALNNSVSRRDLGRGECLCVEDIAPLKASRWRNNDHAPKVNRA